MDGMGLLAVFFPAQEMAGISEKGLLLGLKHSWLELMIDNKI